MINEVLGVLFHFVLYFGIIALVAYFIYPLQDGIEHYFDKKVVWITGKSPHLSRSSTQSEEVYYKKSRLVLGASSGIGRELAKELARICPSVSLVLSARREEELKSVAAELNLDPKQYLILPLDLEQHEYSFESKLAFVLNRLGDLDVLINNAGISQRSLIKDTIHSVDSRLISINYLGTVALSKTVLPVMAEIISVCIHLIDIVSSISCNVNEDITWW